MESDVLDDILDSKDRIGLVFSLFSKKIFYPFIPFFSFSNMFYKDENSNDIHDDILSFGAAYQKDKYIVLWCWSTLIRDDWELNIEDTSFYLGFGFELL